MKLTSVLLGTILPANGITVPQAISNIQMRGLQGSQIYEVGFFGNQKRFGQIDGMFMPELTLIWQKVLFVWNFYHLSKSFCFEKSHQ